MEFPQSTYGRRAPCLRSDSRDWPLDKRGFLDGTEYGYRRGLADGRAGQGRKPVSGMRDLVANLVRPKSFLDSYVKGYGRGYEEGIRSWRKETERREFGTQAVRETTATPDKEEDDDPSRDAGLEAAFAGAKVAISTKARRSMSSGLPPERVAACIAKANSYIRRLEARGLECADPVAIYAKALVDRWDEAPAKRGTPKPAAVPEREGNGRELSPGMGRER